MEGLLTLHAALHHTSRQTCTDLCGWACTEVGCLQRMWPKILLLKASGVTVLAVEACPKSRMLCYS
eukprot:1158382-Pelagomonas_calceolata.AAC.10